MNINFAGMKNINFSVGKTNYMPNNNTIFKSVEETYYIYNAYQITSHSFFKKKFFNGVNKV